MLLLPINYRGSIFYLPFFPLHPSLGFSPLNYRHLSFVKLILECIFKTFIGGNFFLASNSVGLLPVQRKLLIFECKFSTYYFAVNVFHFQENFLLFSDEVFRVSYVQYYTVYKQDTFTCLFPICIASAAFSFLIDLSKNQAKYYVGADTVNSFVFFLVGNSISNCSFYISVTKHHDNGSLSRKCLNGLAVSQCIGWRQEWLRALMISCDISCLSIILLICIFLLSFFS